MGPPCRRYLSVGICLFCLAAAGCMQVPFFLPEINFAPGVDARCKRDEVYAFRVDVTQKTVITEGLTAVRGKITESQTLARIPTSAAGTTSPQLAVSFSSGWRYVGLVNFTAASTEHGVSLRFYRPGFETIAIKPGEGVRELQWKEAPDLGSQVKAIDDLLRGPSPQSSRRIDVEKILEPGTKAAAHREVLRFAAGEYERLSRELSSSTAEERSMQQGLLAEANRLKDLAEGKR